MWKKIQKHIGQHYTFRLDGIVISGFFCGIGEYKGDYGMIFLVANNEKHVSPISCLLVHPLKVKCTLYSDMLDLRRTCRKFFDKHNMKNTSNNIYHPSFEVKEIKKKKVTH